MNLNPLFQWLLVTSLMGSILTGIIILTKGLFKNKFNANWHYCIWFLLIARLVMPFGPESSWSVYNVINNDQLKYKANITVPNNNSVINQKVDSINNEATVKGDSKANIDATLKNENKATAISNNANNVNNLIADTTVKKATPKSSTQNNKFQINYESLGVIWLMGVILLLIYILAVNLRFSYKIKRYGRLNKVELGEILTQSRENLKINYDIPVIYTSEVKTPSLYGVIRPKLLIPDQIMNKLSLDEKKYVLMHELAHLKRKDLLINWLTLLLQIIHWFNPIIWYAFYRMRRDTELACDAYVLSKIKPEEHRKYGETLIDVLQYISKPYWAVGNTGMVNDKKGIKERVIMISKFKKKPLFWTLLGIAFFTVLAVAGLTNSKANEQVKATQHKSTEKVAVQTSKSDTTKKSENKSEENTNTNINTAKQIDAPVVTEQSIAKIGKADADLADFVIKAEYAFVEMSYKRDNNDQVKSTSKDGDIYLGRRLAPYDTKEAVLDYFQRYWSPEISQKMYNNLHPQVVNGKLYTVIGDPPFVIYDKNQVYVNQVEGNIITVSTKSHLDPGPNQEIILKIKVTNGNRQIIWRSMQDDWKIFYE